MPIYDRKGACGHIMFDCYEPVTPPEVKCSECGAPTERVWLGKANSVIPDDIPGGVWIRHGLVDENTGEPVKYYSKSEIAKEAKRRGLVNLVEHVTDPKSGSDKSKFTTKWF